MAPRVMRHNQGASCPEAVGWRAPLPFWALRAAKLCRVKRFLERAELSEVELVTASSAGREGGAGGAGRSHPGPPQAPRLTRTCPGPRGVHTTRLLWAPTTVLVLWAQPSTHLRPSQGTQNSGLSPAPTFALPGGPGTPGSAQHPPRPSRGAWRSGLSPAPTFALPGWPGAPGSAQHPPLPFSGALCCGVGPPYPSRLSGSVFLSSNFFMFLVLAFKGLMTSDAWKKEKNIAVSIHRPPRVGRG